MLIMHSITKYLCFVLHITNLSNRMNYTSIKGKIKPTNINKNTYAFEYMNLRLHLQQMIYLTKIARTYV
jgi:hypothetical protein